MTPRSSARRRLVACALVVSSSAAACSGDDAADPAATAPRSTAAASAGGPASTTPSTETVAPEVEDPPPSTTGAAPAPTVELLDAGAEPRRELRIRPTVGDAYTATTRQEQSQELRAGGQVQQVRPPITEIDVSYTVETVADGVTTLVGTLLRPRVLATAEDDAATVQATQAGLDAVDGLTSRTVVDELGNVRSIDFDLPSGSAAAEVAAGLVEGLEQQGSLFATPFPLEAVGLGAVWSVTAEATVAGLPMLVRQQLTVTELTDTTVTMRSDLLAEFVAGPSEVFGRPIDVEGGQLAGIGTVVVDLGRPTPSVDLPLEGTVTMTVETPEDPAARLEQTLRQRSVTTVD